MWMIDKAVRIYWPNSEVIVHSIIRLIVLTYFSQSSERPSTMLLLLLFLVNSLKGQMPNGSICCYIQYHLDHFSIHRSITYNLREWKRNGSKCYWKKKQIEHFHIHSFFLFSKGRKALLKSAVKIRIIQYTLQ